MARRMTQCERDVRELHGMVNDLLSWCWREYRETGYSWGDRALNALALRPDLPLTVVFADEVRKRSRTLRRRRPIEGGR